ncbi:DNA-3-methyladenine glycosylase family protein [Cellulomonas denverensis]|uniref:DNA-3-methyladenine glycosylase family protein n=1 Tax=Cellulomonas denverensis TaxID=264297 RepID=UPI0035E9D011
MALVRLALNLPVRRPYDAPGVFGFLAARAVAGVESADLPPGGPLRYARTLHLPHGPGAIEVTAVLMPDGWRLRAGIELTSLADVGVATARVRRLLDLDADPAAVDAALSADPVLAPLVAAVPGLRVPGAVDPEEMVLRAMVGQQISVAAARGHLSRLAARIGTPVVSSFAGLDRLFPTAAQVADALGAPTIGGLEPGPAAAGQPSAMSGTHHHPPSPVPAGPRPAGGRPSPPDPNPAPVSRGTRHTARTRNPAAGSTRHTTRTPASGGSRHPDPDRPLRLPGRSVAAIRDTAAALADGSLRVDVGASTADLTAALVARPGIGPWTAGYLAIRVLGDPDVWLPGDAALLTSARALGFVDPGLPRAAAHRALTARSADWAPWRSYAVTHLWRAA